MKGPAASGHEGCTEETSIRSIKIIGAALADAFALGRDEHAAPIVQEDGAQMSGLRARVERVLRGDLVGRVRQIVLGCVVLGAAVLVGKFVDEREPARTWLFFPYAGFCLATLLWVTGCTAFGHAALRLLPPLGIRFRERLLFDFATGVLLFAVGLFVRGTIGVLGPSFYFVYPLALLAVGGAFSFTDARRAWRHFRWARRRAAVRPSIVQQGALMLATVGFGIVYLTIMVPENAAFDARSYHLPIAEHFASWKHVGPFSEGWYAGALPHLASWLYTWPFTLTKVTLYGHVELCAHLEFALFVATVLSVPLLVEALCPGRRARGVWAAFFLFPGIFLYDSSLGIAADHVLAFWAVPLALAVWRYMQRPADVARGVLAGLMVAAASLTKYQSIYLVVPAGLAVTFSSIRELTRRRQLSALAGPGALLFAAAVASAPHWLANVVWYGNPVFPLARDLFPSSHPVTPGWAGAELDHQFELVGPLAQKLEKALKAVFTFSFVPNDWWEFHRDVPVFGFLFTMTLPILLVARGGRRAIVLALGAMMGVFIWYWTYHQDRYLQAVVPWMVASAATALGLAWSAGAVVRAGVVLLVGVQIVWGAMVPWLPSHAMLGGDVPALRALRLLTAGFRNEPTPRLVFETGYEPINKYLPKDAYVLLHEEYMRLGLKRRAMQDSLRLQPAIDYRYLARPDRVHAMMKTLGATHIVWRHKGSPNREVPLSGELVFWNYTLRYGEARVDLGDFGIVNIPIVAPPAIEPGLVTYLGCNGARNVALKEVDALVAAGGAGADAARDPAELIAAADFVVVEQACASKAAPTIMAPFAEAAPWGSYNLWVKRP
jgi:hypothetical protein